MEKEIKEISNENNSKFKKYLKVIIFIGLIIFFVVGFTYKGADQTVNAELKIKDYGTIYLELDGETAPITVRNFIKLANSKFYDGLTFHRIIEGFMIQGGDPLADGTGGTTEKIKGEFSSNGVENNIKHERGVISMARSDDKDSASSQFFIVQEDSTHLDGNYAAFGHVTEGMDIVDKIAKDLSELGDDNGLIPKDNQPIIEYIKIIKEK